MKRTYFYSILAFICLHFTANAQENWTLKQESDDIKVYSRTGNHSKFNELKAELTVNAKLSDLVALLEDVDNYYSWSFNTKSSYVLKKVSPADLYFYTLIDTPWPVNNRDLVVHLQMQQERQTKVLTIKGESVPDFILPKENIVRIPMSKETWIVKPIDKNSIKIEYYLELNPGDNAPSWLINKLATKGPLETFKNLKMQLQNSKYRQVSVPFIVN